MVNKQKTLLFSAEEIHQIEAKIKSLEKTTSGEIVVQVVATSGDYRSFQVLAFLIGVLLASLLGVYSEITHEWGRHFREYLLWQISGGCLAALLSCFPPFTHLYSSKRLKEKNVQKEAWAYFSQLGMQHTQHQTGIMIFLSAFEKQVVILADRGIHKKVGETYWKDEAHSIAQGFREKKAAQHLIESLDRMNQLLSTHFPVDPGDRNELPDEIRF